jgi:hypothetical protein
MAFGGIISISNIMKVHQTVKSFVRDTYLQEDFQKEKECELNTTAGCVV